MRVLSPGLPAPFGSAPQGVDVRVVPAHPPRLPPRGGWLARNLRHAALASPWLHEFEGHDVDAIKAVLPAELEDFRPEVVQIEHSHLSPLLEALPDGLPTVLVMHNLTFPMTSTLLGARRPRGAHGRLMETALVARAERRAIGRATRVVAVSGHDVWLCQKLQPTAVVREIPNCLPVGYFACYPRQVSADPTLIFTASFFWPPNQEAASLLVRRILPMVRRTHPTARLLLVGRGMPDDLRAVTDATDACTVIGEVADTLPYLASAWVSVVPLFSAGGTQLKVLESLAAGLPVVTTARVAGR
ncbi:MAG: glycosyltransferase, partial [Candidatus Dormibacteria bacterium]